MLQRPSGPLRKFGQWLPKPGQGIVSWAIGRDERDWCSLVVTVWTPPYWSHDVGLRGRDAAYERSAHPYQPGALLPIG